MLRRLHLSVRSETVRHNGVKAAVALVTFLPILLAATYCEDIDGNYIVVGEARYRVEDSTGDDSAYANSYWDLDTANELALDAFVGGADHSATNLGFYEYAYLKDVSTDCADATFSLRLQRSSSGSAGCPGGSMSDDTFSMVVASCDTGVTNAWAGKLVGATGLSFRRYWNATVSVTSSETTASDSSCYHVKDESECTLVDY